MPRCRLSEVTSTGALIVPLPALYALRLDQFRVIVLWAVDPPIDGVIPNAPKS
jgi:hypothetical protein